MYYESVSLLLLKVHLLPCLEALSFLFIVGAVMFCNNRSLQNMPAPMHFYGFKLCEGLVGYLYSYMEIELAISKLGWIM